MPLSRTALLVLLVSGLSAHSGEAIAESVCVKYGPCPLELSAFDCTDTPRSSFIRRVCYHADKRFMAIKLKETWYPYCEVDAATVQGLLGAESAGRFYNANIRSKRDGLRGPFDCRDRPMPIFD